MSPDRRQLRPSGIITFNGTPLSPLISAVSSENIDVETAPAAGDEGMRTGGGRVAEPGGQGRGATRGGRAASAASSSGIRRGAGRGGVKVSVMAERGRRRQMNDMFNVLRGLLPRVPHKSNKAEVVDQTIAYIKALEEEHATLLKRKLQRDRLMMPGAGGSSSSSSSSAAPAAAQPPRASDSSATARPGGPAVPFAPHGPAGTWPLPAAAAMPPPPGFTAAPASFQTWSGPNVVLTVLGHIGSITVCAPRHPTAYTTVVSVLQKYRIAVVTSQIGTDHSGTRCMFMIYTRIDVDSGNPLFVNPKVFEGMYRAAGAEIMAWFASKE